VFSPINVNSAYLSVLRTKQECPSVTAPLPQSLPEGILKTLLHMSPGIISLFRQKMMFAASFI